MNSTAKSVFYYSFYMLGMVGIVLFLPANPLLILIGSVDLFGAVWTALTLRNVN